jgi:hypothetical protein
MKNQAALMAVTTSAAGLVVGGTVTAAVALEPGTETTCGRLTSGAAMTDNPAFGLAPTGPVVTTAATISLSAPSAKGALR